MQTDSPIPQDQRWIPQVSGPNGSKIDLDQITFAGPIKSKDDFEAARRILGVRREILDRIAAQRRYRGKILRHEAEVEECTSRLEVEGPRLKSWHRKDLEGRATEAKARAEYCHELIRQCELEIEMYAAVLKE